MEGLKTGYIMAAIAVSYHARTCIYIFYFIFASVLSCLMILCQVCSSLVGLVMLSSTSGISCCYIVLNHCYVILIIVAKNTIPCNLILL